MMKKRFLGSYLVFIVLFGCLIFTHSFLSTTNSYTEYSKVSRTRSDSDNPLFNCTQLCAGNFRSSLPSDSVPANSSRQLEPLTVKENETITTGSDLFQDYELKWSRVESTQTTIFSAYYDERPELYGPSIVVLGYQARSHDKERLYCLFQYSNETFFCREKSIFLEMDTCNYQKEVHKKVLYKFKHVFHICRLGNGEKVPSHVALSSSAHCNPSTSLTSIYKYRPREKANIGVCLETPIFKKTLSDVVNFIEMQRMFGAQVFTLYLLDVSNNMEAALKEAYKEEGILDVAHWSSTFKELNPLHYYGEILAIQDCLYRNMHRVNYLVLLDLDEVIVSRRHSNWHRMLQELDSSYVDSFIFINSVYLKTPNKELPTSSTNYLHSLLCPKQQLPDYFTHYDKSRCRYHFYERSKVILKPLLIIDTDIHGPCTRIEGKTHFYVPDDMATSQHYRDKPTIECKINRKTRNYDVTYDDWLSRYAPIFLKSVHKRMCPSH